MRRKFSNKKSDDHKFKNSVNDGKDKRKTGTAGILISLQFID